MINFLQAHKHLSTLIVFLFFLSVYGFTSRADVQVSDEIAVFASGINLATTGNIDIESLRWLQSHENLGKDGRNEKLFAKYFIGNVLGTATIYKLTSRQGDVPYIIFYDSNDYTLANSNQGARFALRLNAILGALGVSALFATILIRSNWKNAVIAAAIFGLCTDWWYQSRGLFSEIGAGTFLILSLYYSEKKSPAFSAISLGLSLLFRPTNLLGIPIWAYGVYKTNRNSLWTIIFVFAGVGILGLYNWIRFESFGDFGYANERFDHWIVSGLVGVLLTPGRSVFFYSPILILCISAARQLLLTDKIFAVTLLIVIASYVIVVASWHSWYGGTSWGSRLLTPILPLGMVLFSSLMEKAFSEKVGKLARTIILLSALGFGIQILTLTQNPLDVLVYYVESGQVSYAETVSSFTSSWLSLQIRNLLNFDICNVDSYSILVLLSHCK